MSRGAASPSTLALALALAAGWFGFPGLLWDVAWHRTFGRDSFLTPPHVLMYVGVAVTGLVGAWAVVRGRRRHGAPGGLAVCAAGALVALAGAVLDEWWHENVGKDVNLWSPPHLVGLAGAMLIAVGLVFAVAGHTGYAREGGWRAPRVILLLCFADLVHKSMVALDHYTLDAAGRTADFYPLLLALLLPAVLAAAARALPPGGATATAAVFTAEHAAILLVLLGFGMRVATLTPIPLAPALALDVVLAATAARPASPLGPLAAGAAFALALVVQEAAFMAWIGRPWAPGRVAAAFPAVVAAAAGSAWLGSTWGGLVRATGEGQTAADALGGVRRMRATAAVALVLVAAGLTAAYRPSRREPPARPAALGLAGDGAFDERDAVFWEPLLPDRWREPGDHDAYQEAIVDGRGIPLGPAWCAADPRALARELPSVRFALAVNGEPVDLARYPWVRRTSADGRACAWIALKATTPRPGLQVLVYTLERDGAPPSRITVRLRVKEP